MERKISRLARPEREEEAHLAFGDLVRLSKIPPPPPPPPPPAIIRASEIARRRF